MGFVSVHGHGVRSLGAVILGALFVACGGPPASRFPDGQSALERMHASQECSRGLRGEASLDYIGDEGRVRAKLLYMAVLPDSLRLDVTTPFGAVIATLTSDGKQFAFTDLRQNKFLHGPAKGCNVRRLTRVPVPTSALIQLLRGEAPVLVHAPEQVSLSYHNPLFGRGHYVVRIVGKNAAQEEVDLVPLPEDRDRPWAEQRVRITGVRIRQQGVLLYQAEMRGHHPVETASPRQDPDGLSPAILPSGPSCKAEVPERLRVQVPSSGQELVFSNQELWHNPPLAKDSFEQAVPGGVEVIYADCSDD